MSIGKYTHSKLVSVIKTVIKKGGLGGFWAKSDDDVFYTAGNIGIGTSSPNCDLHVAGAAAFSGTDETFVTFASSDTTPSVANGNLFKTHASGQTLTMFDGGVAGQTITVISTAAVVFDVTGTNLKGGSANITTASGDITTWTFDGTNWYLQQFMDVSVDMSSAGGGGTITALNNATANELVTVGSTTTELDAEANLTFDGTDMSIAAAGKIEFRDSAIYINSSADTILDLVADEQVKITTPIVSHVHDFHTAAPLSLGAYGSAGEGGGTINNGSGRNLLSAHKRNMDYRRCGCCRLRRQPTFGHSYGNIPPDSWHACKRYSTHTFHRDIKHSRF